MAWSGVPASSGYAVRDQGSVIDSPIQVSPSLPAAGSSVAPALNTGILVLGNRGSMRMAYILIEELKVDLAGLGLTINSVGIDLQSMMAMSVARCSFNADIGTEVLISGPCPAFRIRHCVFQTASASVSGVVSNGNGGSNGSSGFVTNCLFDSGYQGTQMAFLGGGNNVGFFACRSNFTTGIHMVGPCWVTVEGMRFECSGQNSQQIKARIQNGSPDGCIIYQPAGSGVDISGAVRSSAVELEGPHVAIFEGNLNGSGCATAFRLSNGARVRLSAGSTITGTAEIVLDGNAAQTIAAMRAVTPKCLKTDIGTIIHE